jgi:subtilase family serine protease
MRRCIEACLLACLLVGWSDRVFGEGEDEDYDSVGTSDDVGTGDGVDGDYDGGEYEGKQTKKKKPSVPWNDLIRIIPQLPQLVPQQSAVRPDLSFTESTAKFDEETRRVALSFCLLNGGKAKSTKTKVVIRDRSAGEAVGNSAIEPLAPDNTACRDDIWVSAPIGFTGTRRYYLTADPDNVVKESREDNNTAVATVEIRLQPDLSIADFTAKSDAATHRVALPLCIVNRSKSAVDRTELSIRDRLTGDIVATTSVGPFPAGGRLCRKDLSAAVPAAFNGTRLYDAMVDPQNHLAESDEDNNAATAELTISALPDLAVANATATFDEAARKAVLSYCVVNRGKVPVKQTTVSIRDHATGEAVASPPIGPIGPGAQACRNDRSPPVPVGFSGARRYDLIVDPQRRIRETDEDNNTGSAKLTIRPQQPDLAFVDTTARFDEATRQVTISFCVVNRGKDAAGASDVSIRDRLTGKVIGSPTIGPLPASDQTCRKDLPALMPAGFSGARQYDLVADSKGRITESDETNNTVVAAAEVSAQPDLGFTDTAAKFDEPAREMVLSFCVINHGTASSSETRVSIRDPANGAQVGNPRIQPLTSGQRTCRDGLLLPVASGFSGTQRYELTVDPDGKVSESDEDNNTAQAEAYVSALPNLAFADSSTRFDEATRRAMLSFCVVNRGQASSNEAALSIRDTGTVVASLKAGALSPSSQACFNDVAMPTLEDYAGTRSYELIVDADNATNESDENDNMRTVSVAVPELPAPADYATAAGPADEPTDEPAHMPLAFFVVAIVGVGVLSGGIVFLLVRPRSGKHTKHVPHESIQFRGRPDPGTQITHSAAAQIVLPRLQLRGHLDPGHQHIEMPEIEMRIAGE